MASSAKSLWHFWAQDGGGNNDSTRNNSSADVAAADGHRTIGHFGISAVLGFGIAAGTRHFVD